MRSWIITVVTLALANALVPGVALATACNKQIVVQIAFARGGASQWVHRGPGTTYIGYFQKGQSLTIAAAGGTGYAATSDLSWAKSSQDPWEISMAGPGGFSRDSDFGVEPFVVNQLPATGKYTLTIFPCADWGEPGTMMIISSPE